MKESGSKSRNVILRDCNAENHRVHQNEINGQLAVFTHNYFRVDSWNAVFIYRKSFILGYGYFTIHPLETLCMDGFEIKPSSIMESPGWHGGTAIC